ncbi:hypothetical protein H0A36_25945, partial [Endozoicomonas sp. SM1973]
MQGCIISRSSLLRSYCCSCWKDKRIFALRFFGNTQKLFLFFVCFFSSHALGNDAECGWINQKILYYQTTYFFNYRPCQTNGLSREETALNFMECYLDKHTTDGRRYSDPSYVGDGNVTYTEHCVPNARNSCENSQPIKKESYVNIEPICGCADGLPENGGASYYLACKRPDPAENGPGDCTKPAKGNPIILSTGNKYQLETVFQQPLPLSLSFNHHLASLGSSDEFSSSGWRHSYYYQLSIPKP